MDNGKQGWMKADASDTVGGQTGATQVMLRFGDIFGAGSGQIPTDAQILSAQLELEVLEDGESLAFHRLLQAWQDSATWNTFDNGIQTDGGEAEPQPDLLSGRVNSSVLSLDVTTSVQAWLDDPSTNYGWVVLSNSEDGVSFRSANGNGLPRLTVTYQ